MKTNTLENAPSGGSLSSVAKIEQQLDDAVCRVRELEKLLAEKKQELFDKMAEQGQEYVLQEPFAFEAAANASNIMYQAAALVSSEDYYRKLFVLNPQCMWIYDAATLSFIEVNEAVVQKYGYGRDEFKEMTLAEIIPAEDVELFHKINSLDTTEETSYNDIVRHKKKNGEVFYAEVTTHTINNAGKKVRLAHIADLTTKIEAEQLYIESNEEISAILESITDGFYALSTDWKVTYCNSEAERILGIKQELLLGQNFWHITEADMPQRIQVAFEQAVARQVSAHLQEYYPPLNAWLEISAYPSDKGLSVYIKDITEHKRLTEIERLGKEVLEMNALPEKTLEEIISYYLQGFEKIYPGMLCSFIRLEKEKLFNVAAPSLPQPFIQAIDGSVVGQNTCSCGAAAKSKQKIIVSNIQSDERCRACAALATEAGIRAAWSYPLVGIGQEVIGLFNIYHRVVKLPTEEEEKSIESARNIVQVIFENKLAQAALKQSNERFNYATAASNDAIYDWDIVADDLQWGAGFEKIFDYIRNPHNSDINSWVSILHPDDAEAVVHSLTNALQDTKRDYWKESYKGVRADKSVIYVIERSYIIRDADGKAIRMVGALQDVTEQKLAEEELRKLSIIAKETVNAVVITNAAGETLWVNDAFTKITEYELADMYGKKPGIILQGEESDPDTVAYIRQQLIKQEAFETEIVNYTKAGRKFWIRLQIQPLYDEKGNVDRFFALQTDITKAKEEEQQLRLLESVITNATDSVLISRIVEEGETNGLEVIYVNEAFTNMTGYTLEDVLGKDPSFLNGEETSLADLKALETALARFTTLETEIRSYKQNGDPYWCQLALIPIADTKGKFTHWISIQRNITSRKKYEEERELMIRELTQSNNDLRQFSFITSHNLRAPLSNLIGITNLLKPEAIPDARSRLLVQKFKESTFQLNNTINDLLEILVIKNNVQVKKEKLSFGIAFAQVVESVAGLLEDQGGVETDFSAVDEVTLNSGYLHSILLNLLTNAIKYKSPERKLEIRLKTTLNKEGVELRFSDNGLGINLERYGDRIFGLYQRFHNHPDSKGMGLYITHSQVKAMGGQIQVESEVGKGTTFIISFKAS